MNDSEKEKSGSLYRIDHDLTVTVMLGDMYIPNGPAFSPDGTIMYHADSRAMTISEF